MKSIRTGERNEIIITPGLRVRKTTPEGRVIYEKIEETPTEITLEEVEYNPLIFTLGSEIEVFVDVISKNLPYQLEEKVRKKLKASPEALRGLFEFATEPSSNIDEALQNFINKIIEVNNNLENYDLSILPLSFWPYEETPGPSLAMFRFQFINAYGQRFFDRLYLPAAVQYTLRIGRDKEGLINLEKYLKNFIIGISLTPFVHILSQSSPFADGRINLIFQDERLKMAEHSHRLLALGGQYSGAGYGSLQIAYSLKNAPNPQEAFLSILNERAKSGAIRPPVGLRLLTTNDIVRLRNGPQGDLEISATDNAGFRFERIKAIWGLSIFLINILNQIDFKQLLRQFPYHFHTNFNNLGIQGKNASLYLPQFLNFAYIEKILRGELKERKESIPFIITPSKWYQSLIIWLKKESKLREQFIQLFGPDYLNEFLQEMENFLSTPNSIEEYYSYGKGTMSEACFQELLKRLQENQKLKELIDKLFQLNEEIKSLNEKINQLEKLIQESEDQQKEELTKEKNNLLEKVENLQIEMKELNDQLLIDGDFLKINKEVIKSAVDSFKNYLKKYEQQPKGDN